MALKELLNAGPDDTAALRYSTSFFSVMREGDRVAGLTVQGPEGPYIIKSRLVVGADGAFSKVREALAIPADMHLYPDAYLIAILESTEPISESFYYVGHRQILGLFPATGNRVYLFYMIPSGSYESLKAKGMRDLTQAWTMLSAVFTPAAYGRFAMPRTFYMLMSTMAIGYFVVTAGHALLLSWRARYREAMREGRESAEGKWPVTVTNFPLMIGALFDFFTGRLWWWLAPALSIVALLVGLVMYTRNAVIAVTPFMYALF